MPPTAEDVRRALALVTSRDELEYFYDQLTSPAWIPALREVGLLERPPEPEESDGGVSFPGWGISRFLARVAAADPAAVAGAVAAIHDTRNPRVREDIVDALLALPAEYAARFVASVAIWIHDPFRLALDRNAAALARKLITGDIKEPSLDLIASLAALVPPSSHGSDAPWVPLERYDYQEIVPRLAAEAAQRFGLDTVRRLADELGRGLEAEYGHPSDEGTPRDLSHIWRPAIEDHQQNEDFDLKAKLVVALRDALAALHESDPELLPEAVDDLLERPWAALRRLALHAVTEYTNDDPRRIEAILTDPELFSDVNLHHEFYRLASLRFESMNEVARQRYLELVDETAAAVADGAEPEESDRRQRWWVRNRLGAIEEHLPPDARDRYDSLLAAYGREEHPDFLAYHSSWMGPTSPLSSEEVAALAPAALVRYLEDWQPSSVERQASPEGLARILTEVVKHDPEPYAEAAPRFSTVDPTYTRGLLFGLREALRSDRTFNWEPVLRLCAAVIEKPVLRVEAEIDDDRDPGWAWARTEVAHLLDTGLEERPGGLPIELRREIWRTVEVLARDDDPTPESDARYGPPNVDALTRSINTTRGVAMHAVCGYAWWLCRHARASGGWRMSGDAPEVAAVLAAHLDPGRDPSLAVRAVYGWWLPWLIEMDSTWVRANLALLLGSLQTPLELTAWETYLVHGSGDYQSYEVLATHYTLYASIVSGLPDAPTRHISGVSPIDRFVDHLLRLHNRMPVGEPSALEVVLETGPQWLLSELVDNTGRAIKRSGDLDPSASESMRRLWQRIRAAVERRAQRTPELARGLSPFGWWFASSLPADWTLPELAWVLEQGGDVDPDFFVLPRLGEVAPQFPALSLDVLERIAGGARQPWELRASEDNVRRVLAAALATQEPRLQARAEALTHRLGRLGMHGLRTLLRP